MSDPRRRTPGPGFTLVEIALLISLLGIVLAVAVPTFIEALRTSKVSEASRQLERIHRQVAAYYATPQPVGTDKLLRCLPQSAGPTPAEPSVEPLEVSFAAPESPGHETWVAIGYEPDEPLRFRYSLQAVSGCGSAPPEGGDGSVLTLRAEGDLDGDGVLSTFERSSRVRDGELVPDPLLRVQDRVE